MATCNKLKNLKELISGNLVLLAMSYTKYKLFPVTGYQLQVTGNR